MNGFFSGLPYTSKLINRKKSKSNDFLWDQFDRESNVLFSWESVVQIEAFDVDSHELCSFCGDDTVE